MKKLPKIYQNSLDKKIRNNKVVSYVKKESVDIQSFSKDDIYKTLDDIFSGIGYAFNIPVVIKTSDKVYDTSLVVRTDNNIVTLDNEVISIDDIVSIKRKNP